MADAPDGVALGRHRDLDGRRMELYWRRGGVALLVAFLVLGLFNVFGQVPDNLVVQSSAASLQLHAPSGLRGGLLYEASFTIHARRELGHPTLVLGQGWAIAQQINTLEPSPVAQTSHGGAIALTLGPISAGSTYTLYGEFQVNPTSVGSWPADVSLYDGNSRLVHIKRNITVFP
jgi:hypothetical protein